MDEPLRCPCCGGSFGMPAPIVHPPGRSTLSGQFEKAGSWWSDEHLGLIHRLRCIGLTWKVIGRMLGGIEPETVRIHHAARYHAPLPPHAETTKQRLTRLQEQGSPS